MCDPRTRDEILIAMRCSPPVDHKTAEAIDRHLQSKPMGRIDYYWQEVGKPNSRTYFTHNTSK